MRGGRYWCSTTASGTRGAKTLFDSDIRSRLKFIFSRENFIPQDRRNLRIVEELTSRLSQPEIVGMMDRLSTSYNETDNKALDVCLASNIIEVGSISSDCPLWV